MPFDVHLCGHGPKEYVGDLEMSEILTKVRQVWPDAHGQGACGSWSWSVQRNSRVLGLLYDDACDQGFVMESQWTSTKLPFFLSNVYKDHEGEVQYWEFKPAPEALRRYPKFEKISIHVFND